MKTEKVQKLYRSMTEIDGQYIDEAQKTKKKKPGWLRSRAAAACLCLLCLAGVSAVFLSYMRRGGGKDAPDDNGAVIQGAVPSPAAGRQEEAGGKEQFTPIDSLLAEADTVNQAQILQKIPVGKYTGVYENVQSVTSAVLAENRGKKISGAEGWYYVSGHTDRQYLIQSDDQGEASLWKFVCFDSAKYPYRDVLSLIYQIQSAEEVQKIVVNPATMDNTDGGKAIQEQIGTRVVTDRKAIHTVYQIISSMTCYGSDQWDRIDYGDNEAVTDNGSLHRGVRLGRYLSIVTEYGNEIDGLKYTAVSDMFYEFSGIAYNRLSEKQARKVQKIFHIKSST